MYNFLCGFCVCALPVVFCFFVAAWLLLGRRPLNPTLAKCQEHFLYPEKAFCIQKKTLVFCERLLLFGAQHHLRDLCHHLFSEELQDFERANGTCTKCTPSEIFTCTREQTVSTSTVISTCVCAVGRFVAHICWFEANVGPEAVFGTDERTTEFGHQWSDVAHAHDRSSFSSSVSRTLSNTSCDLSPRSSIGGQVGGVRLKLFVPRRAPFDLFETNKKRNFELCVRFHHG